MTGQRPPRPRPVDPLAIPPGAMGRDVARQVRALLRHLDGSSPTDPSRLTVICRRLDGTAAVALGVEDGLRERTVTDALWAASGATSSRARGGRGEW